MMTQAIKQNMSWQAKALKLMSYHLIGLLVLFYALSLLVNSNKLRIDHIDITGNLDYLNLSHVRPLLIDKAQTGFFDVDLNVIKNILLEHPWVKDVTVERVWPNTLRISIHEQQPVAIWNDTKLLNHQGKHFFMADIELTGDIPNFFGPDGKEKLMLKRFEQINQSVAPFNIRITSLKLDERRAWQFWFNDIQVNLGKDDFTVRFNRFLHIFTSKLKLRLDEMKQIDMRYTNGFAIKWKN